MSDKVLSRMLDKLIRKGAWWIAGIASAIIIAALLFGCMSTTTIKDDRGHTWEVASRNDAMVSAKLSNTVSITVDNRGKPSTLDEMIKLYFMQWTAEQAKEDK